MTRSCFVSGLIHLDLGEILLGTGDESFTLAEPAVRHSVGLAQLSKMRQVITIGAVVKMVQAKINSA